MAKVAFIGLGVMGFPMAGHLADKGGHDVVVYNRTAARAQAWVGKYGGALAATPAAAAKGRDLVFACVGNDDDLRAVTLGDTGAFAGTTHGAIFVDHTTASAEVARELTKAAQADPVNAGKYYYNLGAVYVNTGNTEPAVAAFKKAIEVDPNYADAYYQYGISLMGKAATDANGKFVAPPGTAEAFQKYLDLKPDGPNAQPAKDMMASLGATVNTNFKAPASNQKKR